MNLREFMDLADQTAADMKEEKLKEFVHNLARKIPEEKREAFLELMRETKKNGPVSFDKKEKKEKEQDLELKKKLSRIREDFAEIEKEEIKICAQSYEEYESNCWDGDWEWEYYDYDQVEEIYGDAYKLLRQCVDCGLYAEALELSDLLIQTQVSVDGDGDRFDLGLQDLVSEEIVPVDLRELALYTLYARYQTSPEEKRAQEIYPYFQMPLFKNISIEEMLRIGKKELQDFPDFLDSWIHFLEEKKGDLPYRLLSEAIRCGYGEDKILEVARRGYAVHPALYLEALTRYEKRNDYGQVISIGREAMENIDRNYVIRSQIALKTADAAHKSDQKQLEEECVREAFISDTTPTNYLRLIAVSSNPKRYAGLIPDTLSRIKKERKNSEGVYGRYGEEKEGKKNIVSDYEREILKFLNGNFEHAFALKEGDQNAETGWSARFASCAMSLFMLLLLQSEELQKGCASIAEDAVSYLNFDPEAYQREEKSQSVNVWEGYSFRREELIHKRTILWSYFKKWRREHQLTENETEKIIAELEKAVDEKVKAIVSGKMRTEYSTAAKLAAALGEIKESRGEIGAKESVLQHYRAEFSRYSAFHAELRAYGMRDTRKR